MAKPTYPANGKRVLLLQSGPRTITCCDDCPIFARPTGYGMSPFCRLVCGQNCQPDNCVLPSCPLPETTATGAEP